MKVIGFIKEKKFFDTLIKQNELSHAYFFVGQSMIGKYTFANELAVKITYPEDLAIISNPDILNILPIDGSITIEQVRKARKFLSWGSYFGSKKVLIIDNAHMMTVEAQNALLKVLEEPNASSVLILISNQPDMLLDTIQSRCQKVEFKAHGEDVFTKVFVDQKLSNLQKEFLFEFCHGSVGLLYKLLEKGALQDMKKKIEVLTKLQLSPLYERMLLVKKLADEEREDLQKMVLYWILYMHTRLKSEIGLYSIIENIQELYDTIMYSQFNMQTALERFSLNLSPNSKKNGHY